MSAPVRLFTAIPLPAEVRAQLAKMQRDLCAAGAACRFSREENLHLTLIFLGQTPRVQAAAEALQSVRQPAFSLQLGGAGRFCRAGGDIVWLGVQQSERGFALDARPYRPHITLAREAVCPEAALAAFCAAAPRISAPARELVLYRFDRCGGTLQYTPLCAQPLG